MGDPSTDRRWPRYVFGVGTDPDPRFSFANERTFLAWIRTALGFLAAGVAVAAVAGLGGRTGLEERLAPLLLVVCGLVSGIGALVRWMRSERALRLERPLPSSSLMPVLTVVLVLTGVAALVVVAAR